ncbi:hypothetical protein HFD91_10715 [Enterobacteriaceae bacterium EKM102V]|uniref:hypothetical protein n=1 Tax=Pantoea TaxID=53335 RepID=UPI00142D3827|nr:MULTISPECIES: hypothetical protein [Pantoea]KAF6660492.1 hypothetical protein HFD91_10715 [Enterobacteriaceae bacterium EKM102V]KAF6669669.1 hypothetical protein HFD97_07295 [Pantoea sp. EKM103V]
MNLITANEQGGSGGKTAATRRDAALIRREQPGKLRLISRLKYLRLVKKKTVYLFSKNSLRNYTGQSRDILTFLRGYRSLLLFYLPGKRLKYGVLMIRRKSAQCLIVLPSPR